MATVNSINTGTSSTTGSNKTGTIDKDAFMKMLIAQLQNQDPLNPMDGTQFAAQLAQFSSVEQLSNVNTNLTNMMSSLNASSNAQMANLVGTTVTAQGNTTQVSNSTGTLTYNLSGATQKATINIYNASGTKIKTLTVGNQNAGINTLQWDASGLSDGAYTFDVAATDKNNLAVAATAMVTGMVTGINYKNSTPYLTVNGQDIAFSNVTSVQ